MYGQRGRHGNGMRRGGSHHRGGSSSRRGGHAASSSSSSSSSTTAAGTAGTGVVSSSSGHKSLSDTPGVSTNTGAYSAIVGKSGTSANAAMSFSAAVSGAASSSSSSSSSNSTHGPSSISRQRRNGHGHSTGRGASSSRGGKRMNRYERIAAMATKGSTSTSTSKGKDDTSTSTANASSSGVLPTTSTTTTTHSTTTPTTTTPTPTPILTTIPTSTTTTSTTTPVTSSPASITTAHSADTNGQTPQTPLSDDEPLDSWEDLEQLSPTMKPRSSPIAIVRPEPTSQIPVLDPYAAVPEIAEAIAAKQLTPLTGSGTTTTIRTASAGIEQQSTPVHGISSLSRVSSVPLPLESAISAAGAASSSGPSTPAASTSSGLAEVRAASLAYDPPVQGCQLKPYVLIDDSRGGFHSVTSADNTAYRWYRGQPRICAAPGCDGSGKLQCLPCVRAGQPDTISFFCSKTCMVGCWMQHRLLHVHYPDKPTGPQQYWPWEIADEKREIAAKLKLLDSKVQHDNVALSLSEADSTSPAAADYISTKYPPALRNVWGQIGSSRCYTPALDDVGRALKLHVAMVHESDSDAPSKFGKWHIMETSGVLPRPKEPPPRQLIQFEQPMGHMFAGDGFRAMCFNVLAESYATARMYPYCAKWALDWNYRKHNILREILLRDCEIVSLQEVQQNHYDDFFLPALNRAGYDGMFKAKTRQSYAPKANAIDGCAIFYKRSRFAMREQHVVSYDELARRFHGNSNRTLRRLLKGNVGIIAVLEDLQINNPHMRRNMRPRRLCICNTHIYWDPEFADVKLWQTWMLCRELEQFALNRNLPVLLCGDFNSTKDSSVYEMLVNRTVHPSHPDLKNDPCALLPPPSQLVHHVPLESAYAAIGEPRYTNYTGHFVGVLDYILYSSNMLACLSVLDVDDEEVVKAHSALPNPQFPSDHVSICAAFDWLMD
jgi:CCR4-NOT transcription complex subunit 6